MLLLIVFCSLIAMHLFTLAVLPLYLGKNTTTHVLPLFSTHTLQYKVNNMNVCTHRIFLYLVLTPNVTIYIIPSSITPVMTSYSFSCFFVLSIYCCVCEIVCVFILLKRGIFNCLKWYVKLHSKIRLFHFAPLSGSTHCNVS